MRKVSFESLITKSINRTKLILFQPFSLKKWMCLLLIACLAGAINGGGNFGGGSRQKTKEAEAAEQEYLLDSSEAQYSQEEGGQELLDGWTRQPRGSLGNQICLLKTGIGSGMVGILGLLVLTFIAFFTWLGARFKFIWFNSIVTNDASIKEPFQRYKKEGDSAFKVFLFIGLLVIAFLGSLIFWAFYNAKSAGLLAQDADPSLMEVVKIFALPALMLIAGIIFLIILNVLIDNFVITIMALDRCDFKPAWKKCLSIVGQNKKDILLYMLVLLGLSIATGILLVLIAFVCIIALLIVAGLLLGLPFLLIVGIFKAQLLFVIFAIILGLPLFIVAILLILSIGLPFAVFFKSFFLYFLSSLDCGYRPLLLDDVG